MVLGVSSQLPITDIPTDGRRRQQQVAEILVLTDSVLLNKRQSCLFPVRKISTQQLYLFEGILFLFLFCRQFSS